MCCLSKRIWSFSLRLLNEVDADSIRQYFHLELDGYVTFVWVLYQRNRECHGDSVFFFLLFFLLMFVKLVSNIGVLLDNINISGHACNSVDQYHEIT